MILRCFSLAIVGLFLAGDRVAEIQNEVPEENCSGARREDERNKSRPATLEELKWLTGAWVSEEGGRFTEEHWIAPKGGMMLGINRSVARNGKGSFEFMRIAETPGGVTFFASPGGMGPTPFPFKESGPDSVTFENPEHDFPQRIMYRLMEGQLAGRIEGTIDGKAQSMEWNWKPVRE